MRVIAGKYKGRRLVMPRNNDVRPTTEKVKEAMFSILMPYMEDAVCCDLFSGTGGLGIEAISRGARLCYFCDNDRNSMALIKENISACGIHDEAITVLGDYMKCLRRINEKIDVFIIDPPYHKDLYLKVLNAIESLDLLSDEGIILIEHPKREALPNELGSIVMEKERSYGDIILSIYKKVSNSL